MDYDAIIIGCGHNGLVAAFYLARAGLRVLALEQGPKVGGAATTDELFPGFHFSTCAHSFVLFHPQILDDMQLVERGLRVFRRDPPQFHPFADGQYLLTWNDEERTRESIARFSRHDADAYASYVKFWQRAAQLFDPYLLDAPPTLGEFLCSVEGTPDASIAHTLITGTRRQLLDNYFESPTRQGVSGHDVRRRLHRQCRRAAVLCIRGGPFVSTGRTRAGRVPAGRHGRRDADPAASG